MTIHPKQWGEAAGLLQDHLKQLKDEGVKRVRANPETVRSLSQKVVRPAAAAPASGSQAMMSPRRSEPRENDSLEIVSAEIAACTLCRLCKTRTKVVPGQGNPRPELMFVGEGPGADEDQQGLAFVGKAGQLLTKMIEAMGFKREEVFIGNIVKCRPPDNRVPLPDEMQSCLPYLHRQIDLLKPRVIVCLGATATKGLFGENVGGITKIRGGWLQYRGIDVMPTYHPAYLLRNPPAKPDVWTDLKAVLAKLGRPVPGAK